MELEFRHLSYKTDTHLNLIRDVRSGERLTRPRTPLRETFSLGPWYLFWTGHTFSTAIRCAVMAKSHPYLVKIVSGAVTLLACQFFQLHTGLI